MNYVTGKVIKELREKKQLTQKELAQKLSVSEKTISKWETKNLSANMKKQVFYVCPICGNVIQSIGQGTYSCCGITLPVLEVEEADKEHEMRLEIIDGEYYVSFEHQMTKEHYISFISYATFDTTEMKKMYPEQNAEARFRRKGHGFIYAYCNRHGLMQWRV